MNIYIDLICPLHQKKILFISDTRDDYGKMTRCENCNVDNQILLELHKFFEQLDQIKEELRKAEDEETQAVKEQAKKLKTQLLCFQQEFEALKDELFDYIGKIPQQVKFNHTGALPFNYENPSLNDLDKSCLRIQEIQKIPKIQKNINSYFQNSTECLEKFQKLFQQQFQLINERLAELKYDQINYQCKYEKIFKGDVFHTLAIDNDQDHPQLAVALNSDIKLYDLNLMEEQASIELEFKIKGIVYSDDNHQLLLLTTENGILLYEKQITTYVKKKQYQFLDQKLLNQCLITKNKLEIFVSVGKNIYFFNQEFYPKENSFIQEIPLKGHNDAINQIEFNNDQSKLISCSNDQIVLIWIKQLADWKIENQISVNNLINGCLFQNSESILIYCDAYPQIRVFKKQNSENEYNEKDQFGFVQQTMLGCQFLKDLKEDIYLIRDQASLYIININKHIYKKIEERFSRIAISKSSVIAGWNEDNNKLMVFSQQNQKNSQQQQTQLNSIKQRKISNFVKNQEFQEQKLFIIKGLLLNLVWFVIYFIFLFSFQCELFGNLNFFDAQGKALLILIITQIIISKLRLLKFIKLGVYTQYICFFLSAIIYSLTHSYFYQDLGDHNKEQSNFYRYLKYFAISYQSSNLISTTLAILYLYLENIYISLQKLMMTYFFVSLVIFKIFDDYDLKLVLFFLLFAIAYQAKIWKQICQGKYQLQKQQVLKVAIILNFGFSFPFSSVQ